MYKDREQRGIIAVLFSSVCTIKNKKKNKNRNNLFHRNHLKIQWYNSSVNKYEYTIDYTDQLVMNSKYC